MTSLTLRSFRSEEGGASVTRTAFLSRVASPSSATGRNSSSSRLVLMKQARGYCISAAELLSSKSHQPLVRQPTSSLLPSPHFLLLAMLIPAISLLSLALLVLSLPLTVSRSTQVGSSNSSVNWKPCVDTPNDARETTFYCSSLRVPFNWINPIPGLDADLFLRMYPADEGSRMGSLVSGFRVVAFRPS